ncbi:MAG: hypothetical protein ABI851_07700 [Saprospiraceae bacterium]
MNSKIKLGIFAAVYLLLLTGVGLVWFRSIQLQDNLRPKKLMIQIFKPSVENLLIQEQDIARCINEFYQQDWKKIPIQFLRSSKLETKFEELHVVHHAEVYIDAMENLHVDIYQRDPLFRVMESNGSQYYVDVEGKKIPASMNYSARVPVVTGILQSMIGDDIWKKQNVSFRAVFQVVNQIAKDPFIKALIEQIDMDTNGELTLIPKIGFEKIQFGHAESIFEKLDKLKFFYKEGLRFEGWNVYQTLNLKVKDQVIGVKNLNQT